MIEFKLKERDHSLMDLRALRSPQVPSKPFRHPPRPDLRVNRPRLHFPISGVGVVWGTVT